MAHTGRVTAVIHDSDKNWLISCGHDKNVTVSSTANAKRLSTFSCGAWCTSLQYDKETSNAFVGDFGGKIHVLKIRDGKLSKVSILEGHSGSVRSLLWVPQRHHLFSGSFDKTIIKWDIGGGK